MHLLWRIAVDYTYLICFAFSGQAYTLVCKVYFPVEVDASHHVTWFMHHGGKVENVVPLDMETPQWVSGSLRWTRQTSLALTGCSCDSDCTEGRSLNTRSYRRPSSATWLHSIWTTRTPALPVTLPETAAPRLSSSRRLKVQFFLLFSYVITRRKWSWNCFNNRSTQIKWFHFVFMLSGESFTLTCASAMSLLQ